MNGIGIYENRDPSYWVEIDKFFNRLPARLHRQGRLLRNNLAVHYSPTGDLRNILSGVGDYPAIAISRWLLDDLGVSDEERRTEIERHLLAATFFTFAGIYTQEAILDEGSFFDNEYFHMAQILFNQADIHFSHLVPTESPFWEHHKSFWFAYAEAVLVGTGELSETTIAVTPEGLLQCKDVYAPYKLIPAAVAVCTGKEDELPQLFKAFDHLHLAIKILGDLSTLQSDLTRGRYSYPILLTMAELDLPRKASYNPEALLGAMALTGSLTRAAQECQLQIEACKADAHDLGLNTLINYLDGVETRLQEMRILLSAPELSKEGVGRVKSGASPITTQLDDHYSKSIEMAEGYLLSDLTFKESWEVHRRGFAGASEVNARFPSGLIIEILARNGFDMSLQADAFLEQLQSTNFSYYDHPKLPFVDSDNLGVLLRLSPYTTNVAHYCKALEVPLGWMEENITKGGRIPVWIHGSDTTESGETAFRLLGEGCGTIEANLLIGLIEYDWERYQEIIRNAADQLLSRFIQQGASITVNYPRQMCMWVMGDLLRVLSESAQSEQLRGRVEQAMERYPALLAAETDKYRITPQEAAFLTLASLNPFGEQLYKSRWSTIILKNQRSDGSWYGEPLFFVPNRGEVTTWYASHLLTSAFCYNALKNQHNMRG